MAIIHRTELKSTKGKVVYRAIIAVLILGVPLQFWQYAMMLFNSFKHPAEIIRIPPTFWPEILYTNGIPYTFANFDLFNNFKNTLMYFVEIAIFQITISALAAFSLSKLKPVYGKVMLLFFLGTMMISAQAMLIPTYLAVVKCKLVNNPWSYILISSSWAYSIFLFKGFFDGLPDDLMEAAELDGANSLHKFLYIVVPLSKPVIVVNLLNTFGAVYNDYIMPSLLMPREDLWPIMVRIFNAQSVNSKADINSIFIMNALATIPALIVFLIAQKYIVQGISLTGLKG